MDKNPDPFGRDATQPLSIPTRGWWQVVERVYSESVRDNLSVVAAGCAFYALLAIFPALSALVSDDKRKTPAGKAGVLRLVS
jgi:membrane protein